jgi:hypothetical protein
MHGHYPTHLVSTFCMVSIQHVVVVCEVLGPRCISATHELPTLLLYYLNDFILNGISAMHGGQRFTAMTQHT